MKKLVMSLIAIASLTALAGCVSPYYGDRYGYYEGERYAPYGDGYNPYDGYGYGGGYGGGGYVSGGTNGRGGYVSGGGAYGNFGFGYNRGRASGYYNGYYR